jgi:hypothetical protein
VFWDEGAKGRIQSKWHEDSEESPISILVSTTIAVQSLPFMWMRF